MRIICVFLSLCLLAFTGCRTDYDIAEVAPVDHLDAEHQQEHDHDHSASESCEERESEDEVICENPSMEESMEDSHSGHNHDSGVRNHGTQWFFNQPWAAPFIWGKLLRDAVIFLVLAAGIFLITGRRRK